MERYWNEPCDNIFKAYQPLFQMIYNVYSSKTAKPGQKQNMSLDEFDDIFQSSGILNDLLQARELSIHFNQGLMLHVNEVDQDKHTAASYIEFLEAYARCCDEASIGEYPHFTLGEDGKAILIEDDVYPTIEERKSLPLNVKIENSIPFLLYNCCNKTYRENFVHPKKHPHYGLFILPNGKFF